MTSISCSLTGDPVCEVEQDQSLSEEAKTSTNGIIITLRPEPLVSVSEFRLRQKRPAEDNAGHSVVCALSSQVALKCKSGSSFVLRMHMTPRYIKGNTRATDARITWRKCGLRVLVSDFHSEPETKQSARPSQTITQVLDPLALQLRKETGHAGAGASLESLKQGGAGNADIAVMGKSWGAEHALRYLAKRQSVVDKLVLVAPMGGGDAPSDWRGSGPAPVPALCCMQRTTRPLAT